MVPGPIGDLSWPVFSTQFRQKNNDQQGHQTVSFAMRMAGVPYLLKAGVQTAFIDEGYFVYLSS